MQVVYQQTILLENSCTTECAGWLKARIMRPMLMNRLKCLICFLPGY